MDVDLSPLIQQVLELLLAVGSVLALWLGWKLKTWLGLKEDSEIRTYLDLALQNGIAYGIEKAKAAGQDWKVSVHVKDEAVAHAANYVVSRVPDALKRFGITPLALQDLIKARLPQS